MSTLTLADRSSSGATAADRISSLAPFPEVQAPLGRSSSPSPDGIAVNRGAAANTMSSRMLSRTHLNGTPDILVDLSQHTGFRERRRRLTQINSGGGGWSRLRSMKATRV